MRLLLLVNIEVSVTNQVMFQVLGHGVVIVNHGRPIHWLTTGPSDDINRACYEMDCLSAFCCT